MPSIILSLFSAAVTISILMVSSAFAAGDPASGEKLAKEQCIRCHDVTPGGAFKTYPPSFASIAAYRSQEQIYAPPPSFPVLHRWRPEKTMTK
jgi:cytochrome c2